ncbi:ATP-binding cassette sub-family G member 1 [Blattella germanica]|nr:ATP-binding cassette sub-family G member 1 [Blattella germanica]
MAVQQDEEKGLILQGGGDFTIDFKNVSYYSNETEGKGKHCKRILHNINATFKSGHLTAILGPSGAGKTTLLNILSGFRKKPAIIFYADGSINDDRVLVDDMLELLGLGKVESVFVGKLSGGEKKRLSIGIELLTNPPIMLFDEPTSGLDSSSSFQVITHLKSLAQSGRIVVCSIHQPSSRLFDMFDDVLLLANGQNFYNGSVEEMTTVLEKTGFQCPRFYNRADFAIEVVSSERGDPAKLANSFISREEMEMQEINDGEHSDNALQKCKTFQSSICQKCKMISLHRENGYPVMFHMQFLILLKRAFLCTLRDLVLALLLGIMYYGMGDEASKTSSNVAYVFFFILFLFFSNAMPTVLIFPIEAAVFHREYLNNWYSLTAYYTSKLVAEIPLQLGIFLVPASSIPMILFSGFFMKLQDFPGYLKWLADVSYFRYAFEGAMQCIYGYDRRDLTCSVPFCFFKASRKILEEFGMEDASYCTDVMALAVWIFFLQMCLLVALKMRVMMY